MKTLLALILLFFPSELLPQAKDQEINYLVVRGRAEVKVPIDYLEVSISINTFGPSFKVANDSNRALVFNLFDVLHEFGIADSDFQTMNNSSNQYDYNRDAEKRMAVQYLGTLTLRRPKVYDSLFQAVTNLGNISMMISGSKSNQHAYFRTLAYQRAVEAARAEGEMMLRGSHQSLGRIIKLIQDNRDNFTQYDDIDKLAESAAGPPGMPVTVVSAQAAGGLPGRSTFRKQDYTEAAEVTVIFELK